MMIHFRNTRILMNTINLFCLQNLKICQFAENVNKSKISENQGFGLFNDSKVIEHEWVYPQLGDTGINEDYEKVDFPFKYNYKYKEYGYKIKGEEPTRYGDWERKGRVTDF